MAKVLIVGAGAAGLMAAGAAVRRGHQVTVLEPMDKPGQKILVTGKGRCNVTNDCPAEEFLRHVRTNPRFLYSSLGAFPPAKTMELFEGLGVELKVERGRSSFCSIPIRRFAATRSSIITRICDNSSVLSPSTIMDVRLSSPSRKSVDTEKKSAIFISISIEG